MNGSSARSIKSKRKRRALGASAVRTTQGRHLQCEGLEQRVLLSITPIEDIRQQLDISAAHGITGITIVTHGFQLGDSGGDSLLPLAQAIRDRADAENGPDNGAWLLDYDVRGEGATGGFDLDGSLESGTPDEVVLLFDWAPESNELSAGWGEAAGDALFNMLVSLDLLVPTAGATNPLYHFIGHSFGAAVTSEAVERITQLGVPVDQVTYLDPHDFNQGLEFDGSQQLAGLGQPSKYGATVWSDKTFVDVYYQTRGENGTYGVLDGVVPNGRPIPGAYNLWLNNPADNRLPDPSTYDVTDVAGDHTYVWKGFYLDTVTDTNSTTGYAFSDVGGVKRPSPTNFSDQAQDHQYTSIAPAKRASYSTFVGIPAWDPLTVYNGDFGFPGDKSGSTSNPGKNIVPGWSYHGGGGSGYVVQDVNGLNLELYRSHDTRTHNAIYVAPQAAYLTFEVQRVHASADDTLQVSLGDTLLESVSLAATDNSPVLHRVPIPERLRGQSQTLTFAISASRQRCRFQSVGRQRSI